MVYGGGDGFIRPHLYTSGGVTSIDSQRAVAAGEIVHVVSTWDAATGQLDLYLDGELAALRREGGNPNSSPPINTDNPVFIGRDNREAAPDVVIDEAAFYDYPLTSAQIRTHFDLGAGAVLPPPPPPQVGFSDPGNLANLPSELVAFWDFNEGAVPDPLNGSNFAYDRQADHDGSFGGTATRVPGLVGTGAAEFHTTPGDHVNVGNGGQGNVFSFTSGMTVEAIIEPNEELGSIRYQEIFRKEDGGNRILFSFQEFGGILSFGINDGTGYKELDMPIDGSNGRPSLDDFLDGSPHHVAAAYDAASGFKGVYLDGELVFDETRSPGVDMVSGGAAPAFIGSLGATGEPFSGIIDEVALWSVAITDGEISEHATNVLDGNSYFQPVVPLTLDGSGQTYFEDFDGMALKKGLPKGWKGDKGEGLSRRADAFGLKDGPAGLDPDPIKGVNNVGGNPENFDSSGGDRVATWKEDLDGSTLFDEGDALTDAATDRALGVFRETEDDIGKLNFGIEVAGVPLRAFTLEWDLELWGGDPDDEFRGSEGGGFDVEVTVGGNTYFTESPLVLPGALLDTVDDAAAASVGNPTLIDGNVHSLRQRGVGITEVSAADGAPGNSIQISFDSNVNANTFGWTPAVDNVRLRALAAGDTDANGAVDSSDIVALVVADKFAKGPGDVSWAQGDFNGDDEFGSGDLIAVLVGLDGEFPKTFPTFSASELGTEGDGVPDVIIDRTNGQVSVNFEGIDASSMLIKSDSGIFNGTSAAWDAPVTFAVNSSGEVSNTLLGASMTGVHELGTIVAGQMDNFDFNADLTVQFLDAANPTGGLVAGHVIVVPEPSTWILLVLGSLALHWIPRRRA